MVKNFNRFLKPYGHFPTEHLASTGKQSDPTLRLVMIPRCRKTIQRSRKTIPRCRKTRWLERVGHGPACAHGDTACFRILTESGIMLWRHRLLNTIASKFIDGSCACNLRSETWRRWLSACLRTHLMCAPSRNNFEGTFAGNGKRRVLFCADKTPRLNFSESVHVCVFVLPAQIH